MYIRIFKLGRVSIVAVIICHVLCFNRSVRKLFPILNKPLINDKKLIYLDNAAATQLPIETINVIKDYYETYNSNVHRSQHFIAQKSTQLYQQALTDIAKFIGTESDKIIVTSGATQAIRLVASNITHNIKPGDEIIISNLEHLSNIVPWKIIQKKYGIKLKYIKTNKKGFLDIDRLLKLITVRTRLISLNYASSVLGTVIDTERIASICREKNILFMLDGCQASPHIPIDVNNIGCDLYVSSGHKLYGPTGVGFLYVSDKAYKILKYHMFDYLIRSYNSFIDFNIKGTPPIAQVLGLANSLNFLKKNLSKVVSHEAKLRQYLVEELSKIPGLELYAREGRIPIVSFSISNISSFDITLYLDTLGIATRAGEHCSPLLNKDLKVSDTCRVSLAMYNDTNDIDELISGIKQFIEITNNK